MKFPITLQLDYHGITFDSEQAMKQWLYSNRSNVAFADWDTVFFWFVAAIEDRAKTAGGSVPTAGGSSET